ncbi:MAG TPA: hypothetical protein VF824_05625 [Thermoanaerobaculia bacterium]
MRIAQILLPSASEYERKCQRVDFAALSAAGHEVSVTSPEEARGDVAHVYASAELPRASFVRFPIPYISSADVQRSRWRRVVAPSRIVSPIDEREPLPEAVEAHYFGDRSNREPADDVKRIGSFARPRLHNLVEQTVARIHRFRGDITWTLFDHVPSPADLRSMDLWVDPAVDEHDFDGFVAEAVASGTLACGAKTRINLLRLEQGRTGLLVPPNDPNEMTHAILGALFKPEVAQSRLEAARQTASKFRTRQRLRILVQLYESVIRST